MVATSASTHLAGIILMGTVLAVYVGRVGSPFAVSMVFAGYALAKTVFSPLWGTIADVTGSRKTVLLFAASLMVASVLPLLVVEGAWEMVAVRILYGVFAAAYLPIMLTIVSQQGGPESRGRSLGFFNSMRSLGYTAAQLLSGVLLGSLAPHHVFLVIAGFAVVALVVALFVVDPSEGDATNASLAALPGRLSGKARSLGTGVAALERTGLLWLYVGIFMRNVTWHGFKSLLPIFIVLHLGGSELVMGVLLAIAPAVEVFGMYGFGRIADSVGRKSLVTLGLLAQGTACLFAVAADLSGSTTLGLAILGAGMLLKAAAYSSFISGTTTFIGDVATAQRESELMGLRSTAIGVGGIVGPLFTGAVATVAGYSEAFVLTAGVAVVGAILVNRFLVETRPEVEHSDASRA